MNKDMLRAHEISKKIQDEIKKAAGESEEELLFWYGFIGHFSGVATSSIGHESVSAILEYTKLVLDKVGEVLDGKEQVKH